MAFCGGEREYSYSLSDYCGEKNARITAWNTCKHGRIPEKQSLTIVDLKWLCKVVGRRADAYKVWWV
jgi:hypothetical protein